MKESDECPLVGYTQTDVNRREIHIRKVPKSCVTTSRVNDILLKIINWIKST